MWFKNLFKIKMKKEVSSMNNNGLPFNSIGDIINGVDFKARQVGYDKYEVIPKSYYPNYGQTVQGGYSNYNGYSLGTHIGNSYQGFIVNAAEMKQVIDGVHLPHLNLYRISTEDKEELKLLEDELLRWKKQEQLNRFKLLPNHIRQEIVDEAIVDNLINNKPLNAEFEHIDRLNNLRNKLNNTVIISTGELSVKLKYATIINCFKLNELMEAHVEASLEDELEN